MNKTLFKISKMDCPSEENLIRLKMADIPEIINLDFNIKKRELLVHHNGNSKNIEFNLNQLKLGSEKLYTKESLNQNFNKEKVQYRLFLTLLFINLLFFIIEVYAGYISNSMGLIADSLDMLADSFVYFISLVAVRRALSIKILVSKAAGYIQIILAFLGFFEVIKRFFFNNYIPDYKFMIIISIFALIANGICFYILNKSKDKNEIHIRASMIFTSNDVIINIGVISAGLLVLLLKTDIPDLIIGSIIFALVIQGAYRILKLN